MKKVLIVGLTLVCLSLSLNYLMALTGLTKSMGSRSYLDNRMKDWECNEEGFKIMSIPSREATLNLEFIYWIHPKRGVYGWGHVNTSFFGGMAVWWNPTSKVYSGISNTRIHVLSPEDAQKAWENWVVTVTKTGNLKKARPFVAKAAVGSI